MDVSRDVATTKGPAETFTGEVWVDPITRGLPPSQLNVAAVYGFGAPGPLEHEATSALGRP
jgi:hypothetical protein